MKLALLLGTTEGLYPKPPMVGDLNGDGRPDLVLNGNIAADVLLNLP
jgi:FG-GAP repeat protein